MSKNKRQDKISAAKILVIFAVVLFGLTLMTDRLITSSENQDFQDRYKEIELNMPESMVVSLLGAPNDHSSEFYLGQRKGFEEAYRRAAASGAAYYLVWNLEADGVYAIGFTEEGKVAIVETGGR